MKQERAYQKTYCHGKLWKGEYEIIKSFLVYKFDVNERKKGNNSEKKLHRFDKLEIKNNKKNW